MIHETAISGTRSEPDARDPHLPTAERVIAEMRRTDGALSLRDMADVAHLSPYHFARTFRRVTGVSPGEFQAAVRLEKAKELLLTTDLSVGEVCFEVGYGSLGTFTTRFTSLVGVSPGRLRRLPEELASAPAQPPDRPPSAPPGSGVDVGISGAAPEDDALVFAGLFPGTIPQRRPAAGAILPATAGSPGHEPEVHRLAPVPDGIYHLMAVALPRTADPLHFLLPGDASRVGRRDRPVRVRDGRAEDVAWVTLRSPRSTDPPLLLALAAGALLDGKPSKVGAPRGRAR